MIVSQYVKKISKNYKIPYFLNTKYVHADVHRLELKNCDYQILLWFKDKYPPSLQYQFRYVEVLSFADILDNSLLVLRNSILFHHHKAHYMLVRNKVNRK